MNLHSSDNVGVRLALHRRGLILVQRQHDDFDPMVVEALRQLNGKGAIIDTADYTLHLHRDFLSGL